MGESESPSPTWRTGARATPVALVRLYGDWTRANYRLTPIVKGKVHGLHFETAELTEFPFPRDTGCWAEGPDGEYAAVGQAIARGGEHGWDHVVAAKIGKDHSIFCIDPHHTFDVPGVPAGCELGGGAVLETLNSAANATGRLLQHFCPRQVCTSSHPHPDGAELAGSDAGPIFCYSGRGAGFNDLNGREADESGVYLKGSQFMHVLYVSGYETLAAKRPATSGGWPLKLNANSPVVWRPVSPYLEVGSPMMASGGCP